MSAILFTKRVFTNPVMHSEGYLCRKPASHWLKGPLRVGPSQQCLVESNSINNNDESSSSHHQAWAQRGEASYPRSHSWCEAEPGLKPRSVQPQIHQDTGLPPSQSHSKVCCSNKSLRNHLIFPNLAPGLTNRSLKYDL